MAVRPLSPPLWFLLGELTVIAAAWGGKALVEVLFGRKVPAK